MEQIEAGAALNLGAVALSLGAVALNLGAVALSLDAVALSLGAAVTAPFVTRMMFGSYLASA